MTSYERAHNLIEYVDDFHTADPGLTTAVKAVARALLAVADAITEAEADRLKEMPPS